MKEAIRVPQELAGKRADTIIAHMLPSLSRSFWQKQFSNGNITIKKKPVKPSQQLREGELITVILPTTETKELSLPVLFEDKDIIVINKPRGILTHAKDGLSKEFTVADFMRAHTTDGLDTNRPGIVHRLDRGTSGVIIGAKHANAREYLQQQFANRKIQKGYLALVEGGVDPPKAILRLPIERNPKQPQTFRVSSTGKSAETTYEAIQYFDNHTFLRLHPRTGRTHQLRVHLAYLGHPIVGDSLYGVSKKKQPLFLHAEELELDLPSGEHKIFQAPLPPELHEIIKSYNHE